MAEEQTNSENTKLASWVYTKTESWRNNRDSQFATNWSTYDRAWRTTWNPSDKSRESERSRIVTPALQQAVEAAISEIEETVFGSPEIFDITFDQAKIAPDVIAETKKNLRGEIPYSKMRKAVSEALINGAVFGTGIVELVLETKDYTVPMSQTDDKGVEYNGVGMRERTCVKWRSVNARNFVIDPNSTCIEDALGVAVIEYVGKHIITAAQEDGIYRDVEVGTYRSDNDLEKDPLAGTQYEEDKVKIVRYYGKVPAYMLKSESQDQVVSLFEEPEGMAEEDNDMDEDDLVEAIVVLVNDSIILKAEENPFMMKHRPIVAFAWDHVPGRFWGRGVCEKGIQAQKALDAEVRARLDSLAFVVWPMLAVDGNKLPRGFKMEVRPGRHILTQGPPSEALMQFKFGNLDPNHWQNFENLRQMVFEATGTNEAGGRVPDGSKTGAVSMMLSGMIKRTKRVLFNFYDEAFVPGLEKMAWMLMQYDPQRFPAQDFQFVPTTMMSVSAREYETAQLVQLLQTVTPETPGYTHLISGIVQNTSLHNREQITQALTTPAQPDPQQQQFEMQMKQLAMRKEMAMIAEIESRAGLNIAREQYERTYKPQIEFINAMAESRPNQEGDHEFDKLAKVAEIAVKEKSIEEKAKDRVSNERIAQMQTRAALMRGTKGS